MGTVGTTIFGGSGTTTPGTVTAANLVYAGLRIAGITDRPGRTPSGDQYADAIDALNRMIGSWNIDPLAIYSQVISAYTLTAGQKAYQIGPGAADFDAQRPVRISEANIIVNTTSPVVREPVNLLTDAQWAAITVQDISGAIPWALYNDGAAPISTLYLIGQPLTSYQLELYTWLQLSTFAALTDTAVLPPGYERAIVFNLAVDLAAMFPTQAQIRPEAETIARESLAAIKSLNAPKPVMACDAAIVRAGMRRGRGNYYAYLGNTW